VVDHLVLLKLNPGTPPSDIEQMLDRLKELKAKIPEIVELTCGANFSNRSQGFTHGLFVRFRSRSDLDHYLSHPEHQRVATENIRPIAENILVVDFQHQAG